MTVARRNQRNRPSSSRTPKGLILRFAMYTVNLVALGVVFWNNVLSNREMTTLDTIDDSFAGGTKKTPRKSPNGGATESKPLIVSPKLSNKVAENTSGSNTTTTTTNAQGTRPWLFPVVRNEKRKGRAMASDQSFEELLEEVQRWMTTTNDQLVLHSMEVGMQNAIQCLSMARVGMVAHCIEPSPSSYHRIHTKIAGKEDSIKSRVRFYQMAASDTSGEVEFFGGGGTGDHVGGDGYNVWTMTKPNGNKNDPAGHEVAKSDKSKTVVKSVKIDDFLFGSVEPTIHYGETQPGATPSNSNSIDRLFFLKIDVQGHEPQVFHGMQRSLTEHKIDMILTEFWPKGIDFMNDRDTPEEECKLPVEVLQSMVDAGYILYTFVIHRHDLSPKDDQATALIKCQLDGREPMPKLDSLEDFCRFFYDLERKYRDTGGKLRDGSGGTYEMGYWSDVLAVRPGFEFPIAPTTSTGKTIAYGPIPSKNNRPCDAVPKRE